MNRLLQLFVLAVVAQGLASGSPLGKVYGGEETTPGEFPFMVFINSDRIRFCGGSLISPEWVLSSAICVLGHTNVVVTLGAHKRSAVEPSAVNMTSRNYIIHDDYMPSTWENAVALIKLPSPVELTDRIQPVALPRRSDAALSYYPAHARVLGWGRTDDWDANLSDVLRSVVMETIDKFQCTRDNPVLGHITDNMICCSTLYGQVSEVAPCTDDYGGPLILEGSNPLTLIGVVARTPEYACNAHVLAASVYSRVSRYLDWIEENTGITINP